MSGLLETVFAAKRAEAAHAGAKLRETTRMQAHAARAGAVAHRFREALDGSRGIRVIAEIKRASPSAGAIRANADATDIARSYRRAGAAAISVLTEGTYFKGSLEDLRVVRGAVALPLLRKDFVVDAHDIYVAAAAGADAVLLITAGLGDCDLGALRTAAEDELGMDALVEVHDPAELARARDAGATLIGVNNRNLHTLEVSLRTAIELAAALPPEAVAVAESGIQTASDVRDLRAAGYCAFLIGEALMRAEDPAAALEQLLGAEAAI